MIKIRLIRLKVRRFIRWLIMLRGSPEAIGLGIAIGIFVGFSPLMGFQMLIAIFVHLLLGGIIVGFIAGGASYFLTVRIVKIYRKARLKK